MARQKVVPYRWGIPRCRHKHVRQARTSGRPSHAVRHQSREGIGEGSEACAPFPFSTGKERKGLSQDRKGTELQSDVRGAPRRGASAGKSDELAMTLPGGEEHANNLPTIRHERANGPTRTGPDRRLFQRPTKRIRPTNPTKSEVTDERANRTKERDLQLWNAGSKVIARSRRGADGAQKRWCPARKVRGVAACFVFSTTYPLYHFFSGKSTGGRLRARDRGVLHLSTDPHESGQR